jgi:hypothetical protein
MTRGEATKSVRSPQAPDEVATKPMRYGKSNSLETKTSLCS